MRLLLFWRLLLLFCVVVEGWNYNTFGVGAGPSQWHTEFPTCGRGFSSQSPININTAKTIAGRDLLRVEYSHEASALQSIRLKNSGTALQATVQASQTVTVSGGSLSPGQHYKLAQFHFHWGSDDSAGSEHWLNGAQSPMELHILSYNTNYPTMQLAMSATKGIMVTAVLFELGLANREVMPSATAACEPTVAHR